MIESVLKPDSIILLMISSGKQHPLNLKGGGECTGPDVRGEVDICECILDHTARSHRADRLGNALGT